MGPTTIIGIDIGSSFTKATIVDTAGKVLAENTRDTHPAQPRPGVAEYDGPGLLAAVYEAMAELLAKSGVAPGSVAGICLDAMISGAMGIDAAGDATTPYTTTLDTRFASHLDYVLDNFHDPIRQLTGSGQPTLAPKMLWIRQAFPDTYARTSKFVTISGYVLGKLADLPAGESFMDYTYLWATGLSDTQNYAWSDDLCRLLDLSQEKLPRIVRSSEIIGGLGQAAAAATGLLAGTPIVAGASDQSAGFIGAALTKPNRMASNAGTYPVLAICTDQFNPDMKHRMAEIIPSVIPGLWNPVSYIIGGGLNHHWFQGTFAHADAAAAHALGDGQSVYEVLDLRACDLPPGSERLFFVPHLGGRACPGNTSYRGSWFGFTWAHRREHFYRSVLEGVAYEQWLQYQAFQSGNPDLRVKEVTAYGGGSRSALWNQIKADVLGLPHVLLDKEDLALIGNVILAGHALGIYSDIAETAEGFVQRAGRVEPRPEVHAFYQHYAEFYSRLLGQIEPALADLTRVPEWQT